jgi:transposase-like protein
MDPCPHCQSPTLIKAGHNPSGSQRYQCKACHRISTPAPKPNGYTAAVRQQALRLYLEGTGLRGIGRLLQLHHQTVSNWVTATAAHLEAIPPQPSESAVVELDELYTFVGKKKTKFSS